MHKNLKISTGLLFLLVIAGAPFLPFLIENLSFFTHHALTGLMPIKHQIAHTFLGGEYPLWNPLMLCGAPFHSGIGIADPFLVPYLFTDGIPALLLSSYFALCVAGVSMFFYLYKGWRLSISAAMVGGLLYALNPFFAATCHETPFMAPFVYLPLVFLFFEQSLSTWKLSRALLSGFFLALVFLSGNLESFFLGVLFFISAQFIRACLDNPRDLFTLAKRMLWLAIPIVFSFLIAAIDFLPTLDVLRESSRAINQAPIQQIDFFVIIVAVVLILVGIDWRRRLGLFTQILGWCAGAGLIILFLLHIDWQKGFVSFAPNLFFPDIHKLMLHGQEAFTLLQRGSGVSVEGLQKFMDPRFIFYIQPPIYLFSSATLLLFFLAFLKSGNRVLAGWGWFALLVAIFPFTSAPNLFYYIFHFDLLAYPRLMFIFFFFQSLIVAYGFHMICCRSSKLSAGMRRSIVIVVSGICVAGVTLCLTFHFGKFDPLALQLAIAEFSSLGMSIGDWLRRSWLHQVLMGESLTFFLKTNPWLLAFYISKFLALLFCRTLTRFGCPKAASAVN